MTLPTRTKFIYYNHMGLLKDFKNFAMRGNVIDIAIGMVIGAAFQSIVNSLVADILMPPLGMLLNGVDFVHLKIQLNDEVAINYGKFIQSVVSFIIVAFAIFMMIKIMNAMRKKELEKPAEPAAKSDEVLLLTEIRDLLKK
jgi:large conductance mechanosensitive channel